MKAIGLVLAAAMLVSVSCDKNREAVTPKCDTFATIVDLRGLDGCGFVFELSDGTRLEPLLRNYVKGIDADEEMEADPLYLYDFVHGQHVKISYEVQQDYGSDCMVGQIVKITCLTEVRLEYSGK